MAENKEPGGAGQVSEGGHSARERRRGGDRPRTRQGQHGQHGRERISRLSLRNWRVPARLTALILVPTVVGVLLAGLRVVSSIESVGTYQRHATEAASAADLRALAAALGLERDRAIWSQVSRQQRTPLARQREVVDAAAAKVREDVAGIGPEHGARAVEDARQVGTRLDALAVIRESGRPAEYGTVVAAVLRLHDELLQHSDDPQLTSGSRGLIALAHAKEEASQQRGTLLGTLARGRNFTPDTLEAFIASRSRQRAELNSFNAEAGADNGRLLAQTVQGGEVIRAELTKSWAIALASRNLPIRDAAGRASAIKQWFDDSTKTIDLLGQVEQRVASGVASRGVALESTERRNAIIAGVLILALLLLVLTTTVLIARSMVRPLRRLRAEALEIAGYRLPSAVRRMREDGATQAPDVQPILVGTADEIGEVATAFDEVHRQALFLAAEESQLRGNVNAMFVNLSRRIQTLVERQISLIDGLERGEEDGRRLADLFKLDHLATRMRRNSENLLVLAGHEAARKRSQPAKLVDVVRASLSEVEDYQRVTVKVHRSAAIAGHAANDVVHLIAELVENALSFSPGTTRVVVSSSMIEGGGALLAISDSGIGMTQEEVADVNRRLADPPVVDVSVSRRMGLFVVGRLSLRHGIRVQMRRGDSAGLIAMVLFPPQLITVDAGRVPAAPQQSLRADQGGPVTGGNGASAPSGSFAPFATPGTGPVSAFGDPPTGPHNAESPQVPRQAASPRTGPATGPAGPIGVPSGPFSADSGPYVTRAPEPYVTRADGPDTFGGPPSGPSGHPGGFAPEAPTGPFGPPADARGPVTPEPLGPRTGPAGSPLEQGDEYLPIFAAVESAWFRRPDAARDGEAAGTPEGPATPDRREDEEAVPAGGWGTSADQGRRAADAVRDPSLGGITAAGLPKRTPKANLVPGSLPPAPAPAAAPAPRPARPEVSADVVRARMSRFQQGIQRGRADISEAATRRPGPEGPAGD